MASQEPFDPDQFLAQISEIDKSSILSVASDVDRRRVVVGVQALLARLQSPYERTIQLLHTDPYLIAAVKTLINLNFFTVWV
ncbi:hypothetical protein LTR09_003547 [Extremus antarcticus]|uniref:Uncharacterized protein n=1 Tax=Extremus antarcticus TaxID=702011 RepID=A0AAJ0GDG5_9PEZI|nr:hypothetical protein LTR09_003547 [Extremus antarcticus]